MKPLSKGDQYEEKIEGGILFYRNTKYDKWKCRVRISTGEVVDVFYNEPDGLGQKKHWVYTSSGVFMLAGSERPYATVYCRFVGPAGVRE